jgi:diphthamide biosynthesis protein 2
LNRRYALLSHLQSTPILGILINTLSHSSTTSILQSLTALLRQHGKKYYTFVVGKVNAAKMANFSEIGGWVVVGCWEGGLFDEGGFWRATVTPFELDLALKGEGWKVRGGEWRSGPVLSGPDEGTDDQIKGNEKIAETTDKETVPDDDHDDSDSLSESEPPEYDFRTGQYITSSHARSSRKAQSSVLADSQTLPSASQSKALAKRSKNTDIATVNGVLSPGAEYLRSQRTWQGLGSDFNGESQSSDLAGTIEEGRSGVARGYVVGDGATESKH